MRMPVWDISTSRQGVETCGLVEQMVFGYEIMLRMTGDPLAAETVKKWHLTLIRLP